MIIVGVFSKMTRTDMNTFNYSFLPVSLDSNVMFSLSAYKLTHDYSGFVYTRMRSTSICCSEYQQIPVVVKHVHDKEGVWDITNNHQKGTDVIWFCAYTNSLYLS